MYFGVSTVQLQKDGKRGHSSEAKAFHDYSAAAAPSPVLGNIPPGDSMAVGPVPPGFFQPFMSPQYPGGPRPPLRIPNQALGGVPGSQPLLPSGMDPTRQQGDCFKVKVKLMCRISKDTLYLLGKVLFV